MSFTYNDTVTAQEIEYIRKLSGFTEIHPQQLKDGIAGSAAVICVYEQGEPIGVGRLIWDGGAVALIADMLVIPKYRALGIETEMIGRLLSFLRSKLKPGYEIQVDVLVLCGQNRLFENMGFKLSTPTSRGTPMHICLMG